MPLQPGAVVTFRKRTWVLLPSEDPETWALRPLTGTSEDRILVHRTLVNLLGYTLPEERLQPSTFPEPRAEQVQDAAAVRLFWQAARLLRIRPNIEGNLEAWEYLRGRKTVYVAEEKSERNIRLVDFDHTRPLYRRR